MVFSQDRIDALCAALTAAGDDWPAAARAMPEVRAIHRATDEYRDRIELHGPLALRHLGLCESTLYRVENGTWWNTGFAELSRAQVRKPARRAVPAGDPTLDLGV